MAQAIVEARRVALSRAAVKAWQQRSTEPEEAAMHGQLRGLSQSWRDREQAPSSTEELAARHMW